jgi:hypothetical protein
MIRVGRVIAEMGTWASRTRRTWPPSTSKGGVCCLLMISDMPVGEQRVLGAVLGVQIPAGRQMLLRYPCRCHHRPA